MNNDIQPLDYQGILDREALRAKEYSLSKLRELTNQSLTMSLYHREIIDHSLLTSVYLQELANRGESTVYYEIGKHITDWPVGFVQYSLSLEDLHENKQNATQEKINREKQKTRETIRLLRHNVSDFQDLLYLESQIIKEFSMREIVIRLKQSLILEHIFDSRFEIIGHTLLTTAYLQELVERGFKVNTFEIGKTIIKSPFEGYIYLERFRPILETNYEYNEHRTFYEGDDTYSTGGVDGEEASAMWNNIS